MRLSTPLLDAISCIPDDFMHSLRLGQHRNMARSQFGHLGAHALSKKALQFRLNGAVFGAYNVVGWFGFPRCSENRLTEQVRQKGPSGWSRSFFVPHPEGRRQSPGFPTDARTICRRPVRYAEIWASEEIWSDPPALWHRLPVPRRRRKQAWRHGRRCPMP